MKKFLLRLGLTATTSLVLASLACAGVLDEQYLARFGVATQTALQKAIIQPSNGDSSPPRCGTPDKHGLQRDWDKLEATTQKTLAKQLAAPVLSGPESVSLTARFAIHFTETGTDAATSTYVQEVAQTFEDVASAYVSRGWKLAPTGSDGRYHVYLHDLAPQRLYGLTTSNASAPSGGFPHAFTSFLEIDNNYTDKLYAPFSATQSLQITAAHEYHHAIQYGYNFFFDIWYAEATSSFYEDDLYDSVNQLYTYLRASMLNTNLSLDIPVDTATGGGYGRWLFNRHLSEAHGGQGIIRSFWETLAPMAPINNNDIAMVPILESVLLTTGSSLGGDFFGYASKLYTKAWTTHQNEITLIPGVSMLQTSSTFPITVASAPAPAITLPHYSFVYFKFLPTNSTPSSLNLTITRDNGISVIAYTNNNGIISPININNNLLAIPNFNLTNEVVLLVANTTNNDNLFAGFSSNGSVIEFALPGISTTSATPSGTAITLTWTAITGATSYQIYRSETSSTSLTPLDIASTNSYTDTNITAGNTYFYSVQPIKAVGLVGPASQAISAKASSTPASTGGGGGGGCFIATAAYGSYLHPQVQVLRDFRDHVLLTNAPGRAFVALYYQLSPPVADFIARHESLRMLVRLMLTPLIFAVKYPLVPGGLLMVAAGASLYRVRRRLTVIADSHAK